MSYILLYIILFFLFIFFTFYEWILKKLLKSFSSPAVLDRETQSLHPTFVEYIDGARIYLENETDKEAPAVRDIKLHFCNFIRKMIKSFSCK